MNPPIYLHSSEFKGGSFTPDFPYPYACSFSPLMRKAVALIKADFRQQAELLVKQFEESPELCASLKVFHPEGKIMRQVDLKDAGGNILIKAFLWWDWHNKHWVVFMEGAWPGRAWGC